MFQPHAAEEIRDPHRRQRCVVPMSHCRVSDGRIDGWIISISFCELHASPNTYGARRYALIGVVQLNNEN